MRSVARSQLAGLGCRLFETRSAGTVIASEHVHQGQRGGVPLTLWAGQDHGYLEGQYWQFSSEPNVKVYDLHEGTEPEKKQATMEVKGNKLTVTRGKQKDYQWNRKQGSDVYCWFVHNSGKGFIDGHYTSYIVPSLDSFLPAV